MLKSCARCGRIHPYNVNCKNQKGRKFKQTEESALRSKNAWKIRREIIKERSLNLCAVCKDLGDYSPKPIEVHHIKKLRDYPDGLLEDKNLICLCVYHHKQADAGDLDIAYLRKLVKERDKNIGNLGELL